MSIDLFDVMFRDIPWVLLHVEEELVVLAVVVVVLQRRGCHVISRYNGDIKLFFQLVEGRYKDVFYTAWSHPCLM